jgi:hypothetical protein
MDTLDLNVKDIIVLSGMEGSGFKGTQIGTCNHVLEIFLWL